MTAKHNHKPFKYSLSLFLHQIVLMRKLDCAGVVFFANMFFVSDYLSSWKIIKSFPAAKNCSLKLAE